MNSGLGAYLPAPAKTRRRNKAPRRLRMTTSKPNWIFCVAASVTIAVAFSGRLPGQTAAVGSSLGSSGSGTEWSLQVERIDPGQLDLAHSFQVAIYENLLDELNKTKRFKQVLREGDRKASD